MRLPPRAPPRGGQGSTGDDSQTGLELLARQSGGNLEVGLNNTDTQPHCVAAWIQAGGIQAGERQSDWLSVILDPGGKSERTLRIWDSRDKAYDVTRELAPGETLWTRWDLAAWAKRKTNGGKALPKGTYRATVIYDTTRSSNVWRG